MVASCPCCGGADFTRSKVLWKDLIEEWGLEPKEVDYINDQQGFSCSACGSSLRSMTLAHALTSIYSPGDLLTKLVKKSRLKCLELNEAGQLNQFLRNMKKHHLAEYPDVDMQSLPYPDNTYDIVIHSDTLEHVADPVQALRETRRVLKPGGYTFFTVPIIVDRLTKKRPKNKPSYHGSPGNNEYLVHTEYGADMWRQLFEAGFTNAQLTSLAYPASVAIIAQKHV